MDTYGASKPPGSASPGQPAAAIMQLGNQQLRGSVTN
jgi:hypothetical protein